MYLIGRDAGTLPAPVPVDELLLTPGERADVLVRGERDPVDVFLPSELPYSIEPLSAPALTGVRTFTMSEAPA